MSKIITFISHQWWNLTEAYGKHVPYIQKAHKIQGQNMPQHKQTKSSITIQIKLKCVDCCIKCRSAHIASDSFFSCFLFFLQRWALLTIIHISVELMNVMGKLCSVHVCIINNINKVQIEVSNSFCSLWVII